MAHVHGDASAPGRVTLPAPARAPQGLRDPGAQVQQSTLWVAGWVVVSGQWARAAGSKVAKSVRRTWYPRHAACSLVAALSAAGSSARSVSDQPQNLRHARTARHQPPRQLQHRAPRFTQVGCPGADRRVITYHQYPGNENTHTQTTQIHRQKPNETCQPVANAHQTTSPTSTQQRMRARGG